METKQNGSLCEMDRLANVNFEEVFCQELAEEQKLSKDELEEANAWFDTRLAESIELQELAMG